MNFLRYLLMGAAVGFMSLASFNSAEAARIALLPLINNVAERDDLQQIYYDRAIEVTKNVPDAEIVDSIELDKAIEKNLTPNQLPAQAACEAIARDGGVDVVIMMQVDKLDYKNKGFGSHSENVVLQEKGSLVAYDLATGKYTNKKISDTRERQESMLARYDISGEQFADSVTREIKRILGVKKISVERPRISSSGLKGDKR